MRFAVQGRRWGCMGAEGAEPAACGAALPALCSRRCAAQHGEKRGTVFSHFLERSFGAVQRLQRWIHLVSLSRTDSDRSHSLAKGPLNRVFYT